MSNLNSGGRETWYRLRDWDRGQTDAERLGAHILAYYGFKDIDPSHPRGGPDAGKDIKCTMQGETWIGACYFARGQKEFTEIKTKFANDFDSAKKHNPKGFVFIANQEMTLGQRAELEDLGGDIVIRLIHLEALKHALDNPGMLKARLEFLNIEPTTADVMAFATRMMEQEAEDKRQIELLEKQIKVNAQTQAQPQTTIKKVTPEPIGLSMAALSGSWAGFTSMPELLRTCPKCEEVFYVERVDPYTSFSTMTGIGQIIRCPKCGHIQKWA